MLTVAGRASTEQLQPDLVSASGAIATAPGDNCITLAIVIIYTFPQFNFYSKRV